MTARLVRSSFVSVLLLAAALVVFPGCDTSDPVPPVEPTEVAGVYRFVEFRFNPDPQFVPDAVVLDTLVADSTSIELLNSGQFQFRYRLRGGLDNIINGTFTVDRNDVTLSFESGFEARLRALLLEPTLRFSRLDEAGQVRPDVIALSRSKQVNLEAYSAEYRDTGLDLTNVPGLLEVELRRLGR